MKTTYPGQLFNRQPSTVDGPPLTLHSANLIQNSWGNLRKYNLFLRSKIIEKINSRQSMVDSQQLTLFAGAKSFFKGYDQQTAGLF
jgi:hypothetical protein